MQTNELDLVIERISDVNPVICKQALDVLFDILKSSHTGVFNTFNFSSLNDRLPDLENIADKLEIDNKRYLYDLMSVINVIGDDTKVIKFRIMGNVIPLGEWGHLYVKKLTNCIVDMKNNVIHLDLNFYEVASKCIDFLFSHNAEFEAIDFLIELNNLEQMLEYLDKHNYERMFLYIRDMISFYEFDHILLDMHKKMENWSRYLVTLINHNKKNEAIKFVQGINDLSMKKQCLFILARCNIFYNVTEEEVNNIIAALKNTTEEVSSTSQKETPKPVSKQRGVPRNISASDVHNELRFIIGNHHIKDKYKDVVRELEIEDPYKIDFLLRGFKYDKDIKLGAFISIANSFIHFGFGKDGIFEQDPTQKPIYIYQGIMNSEIPEVISVLGGMGVISSWDSDRVIEKLQEYLFSNPSFKKTGSLLGLGLSGLRLHDENYAILNLLLNNLETSESNTHLIATLLSIQAIYSGTQNEHLRDKLQPYLCHDSNEVVFFTAFTLGSIFLGSADEDLVSTFLQIFMERNKEAESQFFKFMILGIAYLFYARPDVDCDVIELGVNMTRHAGVLVKGFQYINSGNSTVVETILSESFTGETDALLESIGLLSCCLVAIGDDLATQMVSRISQSSLLLDSPHLRTVLPLCLSLLYPSNPRQPILDLLEKALNSGELDSVMTSIIAFGIIGAGSLNSKIQRTLDSQYPYYYKDQKVLSSMKIAQGLICLGKGMLGLNPLINEKTTLLSKNLVGIFAVLFMMLDASSTPLLSNHAYLFYLLCQACVPKYIVSSLNLGVRVGLPVDNVGVVGEPRRITSIQTHTLPIVLQDRERAEIDGEVCTSYIEDVLVIKE